VLNLWLLVKQHLDIMHWRGKTGIKYPQSESTRTGFGINGTDMPNFSVYAEKAEMEASRDAHLFNCAQRE
jgi:hypothetical protein